MSDEPTQTSEGGISSPDSAVQLDAAQNETPEGTAAVETDVVVPEEQTLNEFQLTYDFDDFESDIDSKLAAAQENENTPEFYRNGLKEYKKYANQFREQVAPFNELRSLVADEDLPTALDLVKALHTVSIRDGKPQADVGRFSELLMEKHGDLVPELMKLWGAQQAPGSKYNYFATALQQQYGIEPDQLEAVKNYLDSNTIPQVPDEYAAAYRSLDPKVKEELPYLNADAQLAILKNAQRDIDRDEGYKQQEAQRARQDNDAIENAAEQSYVAKTDSVMTALVNALGQAKFSDDPKINALIAQQNAHMAFNAINPYSAGYNMAKAALKDIGVEIDEGRVNNILDRMSEACRLEAYHQRHNNLSEAGKSSAMVARCEQELLAQVNKVAAGLLKVRSQGVTAQAASQEKAIAATNGRPVIPANGVSDGSNKWLGQLAPQGSEDRYMQVADLVQAHLAQTKN